MQTVIDFVRSESTAKNHRHTVIEIITTELYPEENYPPKYFPDITSITFNLFIEIIKPQRNLWELYNSGKEHNRIKELVQEILNFRNLLKNHPQTVVLIYQYYIEKFIAYKHRNPDDREDIFQEVITRLIEKKIYKIQEKYDFNFKKISSFTSYFMAAVRNVYIDIIRERSVRPLTADRFEKIDDVTDMHGDKKMIGRLILKEEFAKLQIILIMYYKSRARLELCLKLKYRIPITREDIKKCFPGCGDKEVDILLQDFTSIRNKCMFKKILSVFNRHEARRNKSDSLRKWINVKVDEITKHLNRTHGCIVYNNKNFEDFITLYYQNDKGDKIYPT